MAINLTINKSVFLSSIKENISAGWIDFIQHNSKLLCLIEKEVHVNQKNHTPGNDKVLRFLTVNPSEVKIIILGQDPYPQPGIATGRAFEVNNLKSWNQKFRNVSLKNILRALYQAYDNEFLKFSQIVNLVETDKFKILPPDKLFESWENQGVLLLNTSFTCKINEPGSHSSFWHPYTLKVLEFLAQNNPHITWFVWGNHAMKITENIRFNNKFESTHPMLCVPGRENDFLFGKINCFRETKKMINWKGE